MDNLVDQSKLELDAEQELGYAEIVLSNKGGPKLINNGFMYTLHKKQTNNIRWRCVLRSSHCRGSLVTSKDFRAPKVRMLHNHGPDFGAAKIARKRSGDLAKPPLFPEITDMTEEESKPGFDEYFRHRMEHGHFYYTEEPEVILENIEEETSTNVMQSGSQGTSSGRTIRIATQSFVRPQMRNIAPAPMMMGHQQQQQQQRQPKTLVLKTIPLKVKQVAPTTIKMTPRPPAVSIPQVIVPQQPTEVCLRWNSYHSNMQNSFPSLLDAEQFVDVTLACEGQSLKCHKMILSSCSDYLASLLRENPCQHPIILMKDLKFWEVEALVKFMYRGEVNVAHDKLPQLLIAAEALQVKGLAGPSPSLQNPKPPGLVPQSKPLNSNSVTNNSRPTTETKESIKSSGKVSSTLLAGTNSVDGNNGGVVTSSPKRVKKRQSSEPPQPRPFTKIRLQRPITPLSPTPTVKLEPLDIPLSPTEIFPDHHDENSSTASNFDNLVMALHEDDDPGGDDDDDDDDDDDSRNPDDGGMNFCDMPGQPDDINDVDEQMEFVPSDFLEQEQDILEEGDCSNEDIDEDDDDIDIRRIPPDNRKQVNKKNDDRGRKTEKCTNSAKTL